MTKNILIVDDDYMTRDLYIEIFGCLGKEIILAEDGEQALGFLESNSDSIDLLITDYSMPKMDGCQLTKNIRLRYPDLPIVMISGSPVEKEAKSLGVDYFFSKPADFFEIKNVLEEELNKKH